MCHLAWNAIISSLIWILPFKTSTQQQPQQPQQSRVELLRIVWAPQAIDIHRNQWPPRSRVPGIPLSILQENLLHSFSPFLLQLSDFQSCGLTVCCHTPVMLNVGREVLSLKTSWDSGPLKERIVKYQEPVTCPGPVGG